MFILQQKLSANIYEKVKEQFYKFPNHENNSLFYHCEKVFILMNIWIIEKNSMKYHYLKK